MKIKTFSFVISNACFNFAENGREAKLTIHTKPIHEKCPSEYDKVKLYPPEEIDKVVNNFVEDKDVLDVKVNSETLHRHNNGKSDFVIRTYTIIYK